MIRKGFIMKKYSMQTISFALKKVDSMTRILRTIKNEDNLTKSDISNLCKKYKIEESYIEEFLDKIEVDYADDLNNPNTFVNLIANKYIIAQSITHFTNIGLTSLDDIAKKYTLEDFISLGKVSAKTKTKLIALMVDRNIVFRNSNIDNMSKLLFVLSAIVD